MAKGRTRYIWSYGHRNVQGLAQRADGTLWSVEHGPDRDDEVNLQRKDGDYGWNPVVPGDPTGYDESVPMTDHSLPGPQVSAKWSSVREGGLSLAGRMIPVLYGWERLRSEMR